METLDMPLPSARAGPEAQTGDRVGGLAAAHRRLSARGVSARPDPHRWLARRESGPRQGQGLRVSALPVLESVRRHTEAVHRNVRQARGRVAAMDALPRLGRTAAVRGPARLVHWTEVVSS